MSETDLAYAAGLMDGEGCIHIARSRNSYTLQITFNQTDSIIAPWLYAHFNGYLYKYPKDNYQYHEWSIFSNKAVDFLKKILPYLTLKKDQAKLAIQFQEERNARGHCWGKLRPRSLEVAKREEKMYLKMRLLKKKFQLGRLFRA